MTESQFACLQRAVNLARDRQITKVTVLTASLRQEGFSPDDIEGAISSWANYESQKPEPARLGD